MALSGSYHGRDHGYWTLMPPASLQSSKIWQRGWNLERSEDPKQW